MLAGVIGVIGATRLPLADEKSCQAAMSRAFEAAGLTHEREVRLAPGDIVDFLFADGLAVEVKLRGGARAILGQCERYCRSDRVVRLLLATNRAMGLPTTIAGKDLHYVSLGRAWL